MAAASPENYDSSDLKRYLRSEPSFADESYLQFLCTICSKPLIDARYGPCGCEYCDSCARRCFEENEDGRVGAPCPGCCSRACVSWADTKPNLATDRRVLALRALCRGCSYQDSVVGVAAHERLCAQVAALCCPLSALGCSAKIKSDVRSHLQEASVEHAAMIAREFEAVINLARSTAQVTSSSASASSSSSSTTLSEMYTRVAVIEHQITELMCNKQNMQSVDAVQFRASLTSVQLQLELLPHNPFVWRIPDLPQLREEDRNNRLSHPFFSLPFYGGSTTPSPRFCLEIVPDGYHNGRSTHLAIFFYIMRGIYDDILTWPYRDVIHTTLLNQDGRDDISVKDQYDNIESLWRDTFKQPKVAMNERLGYPKFVSWRKLLSDSGFMKNGTIFIRFHTVPCVRSSD